MGVGRLRRHRKRGPRASNRMLMSVGKLDFYMGGSLIQAFSAAEKNIPTIVVAAHFQKEPQVLMSHPGQGLDTFADPRSFFSYRREGRCGRLAALVWLHNAEATTGAALQQRNASE